MDKCYSELIKLPTLVERFEYLRTYSKIGEETFGGQRMLNQVLYQKNPLWKSVRRKVILRDNGYDLGLEDYSNLSTKVGNLISSL